jgi:membrane dipeptidase
MPDSDTNPWGISAEAARLHQDALVWDDHGGFAFTGPGSVDGLDRWRNAGVDYLSINVSFDVTPWTLGIEALSYYRQWVREHPELLLQAETVEDIHRAKREGKLAVTFDIEGMNALNGDLGMVELYYHLGVRHMLFAYNRNNLAGGGCHDQDIGLTAFGRDVVKEMNRLGMVVDCSHSAYRTTMEAMEASEAPVIFSHSNARRLWDHERNIHDDQIKACAATGGVIGVTGIGRFLGTKGATVEHLVEHIDHMVALVGPEHVGIGMDTIFKKDDFSDFLEKNRAFWPERQYPPGAAIGYIPPDDFPRVTQALIDRGYGEAAIRGILGENFLRIASQVWK